MLEDHEGRGIIPFLNPYTVPLLSEDLVQKVIIRIGSRKFP
jgi:hypothetical protein